MLLAIASTFAFFVVGDAAPVVPQMWTSRNTTYNMAGTMAGCAGTNTLTLSYDYVTHGPNGGRMKQVWTSGAHAGRTDVFRYDKTQPGEPWSQMYSWIPGEESLCCYVDLCNGECQMGSQDHMMKLEVPTGATDMGPSGSHGEHWFEDMSIKVLSIGNVNDWIVDTSNSLAISNWTSVASMPDNLGWCRAENLYGDVTLGNLTDADFDVPKFCDQHMCNSEVAENARFSHPQ
jgi:hypothetical protein